MKTIYLLGATLAFALLLLIKSELFVLLTSVKMK